MRFKILKLTPEDIKKFKETNYYKRIKNSRELSSEGATRPRWFQKRFLPIFESSNNPNATKTFQSIEKERKNTSNQFHEACVTMITKREDYTKGKFYNQLAYEL